MFGEWMQASLDSHSPVLLLAPSSTISTALIRKGRGRVLLVGQRPIPVRGGEAGLAGDERAVDLIRGRVRGNQSPVPDAAGSAEAAPAAACVRERRALPVPNFANGCRS